jgi:hypothetical protein
MHGDRRATSASSRGYPLARSNEVLAEFEGALVLRKPPPGWTEAVAPVVEQL